MVSWRSPATTAALVSLEDWLGHNAVPISESKHALRFNLNNRKSHIFSALAHSEDHQGMPVKAAKDAVS